jgi:hypothetical protein
MPETEEHRPFLIMVRLRWGRIRLWRLTESEYHMLAYAGFLWRLVWWLAGLRDWKIVGLSPEAVL